MTVRPSSLELFSDENRISASIASQVSFSVTGKSSFRDAQERILKWAFNPERNVKSVPPEAWQGNSFEIDADHSERAAAVKLDDPPYWAFRLSERLKDTNRIWSTEVGIAKVSESETIFGCRVVCSQRGVSQPVPRSIPAFVRGLAFTQNCWLDGRRLSADAWVIDTNVELNKFQAFLQNPRRKQRIVVITLPYGSDDPADGILDPRSFIRRTVGFVHTVVLSANMAVELAIRIGKELAVINRAVRTYNPGFDTSASLISEHPLATTKAIEAWGDGRGESFLDFLVQQTLRPVRSREELEREHPSFTQVKRASMEQARLRAQAAGQVDAGLVELFQQEVTAAKQQAKESFDLAITADEERAQAIADLSQLKANYAALRNRLDGLLKQKDAAAVGPAPIPTNLSDLDDWADEHLAGEVFLHDRAKKETRNSAFKNADLIYRSLLVLRDYYVPMRREGGLALKESFEIELAALGLENTRCFGQTNKAKSFGGDYFVQFGGEKRELDWHLKGSNSRNEQHSFRLYYFWDDETSQVVVGHMPSHLKTDIT